MVVCQIANSVPFAIDYLRVGTELVRHTGGPLGTSIAANTDVTFAGLESAYQRCFLQREPSYEYMRLRLDSGAASMFERLLLPCQASDNSGIAIVRYGYSRLKLPPDNRR